MNVLLAIVTVPLRAAPVLGDTTSVTLPLPVPTPIPDTATHVTLLAAVHEQEGSACTFTTVDPPETGTLTEDCSIE